MGFSWQYVPAPQCPPLHCGRGAFRAPEDPRCSYRSLLPLFVFVYDSCVRTELTLVLSLSTAIVTAYEANTQHDPNNNNAMLGVHASASAIIQYGKIGRKQVRQPLWAR